MCERVRDALRVPTCPVKVFSLDTFRREEEPLRTFTEPGTPAPPARGVAGESKVASSGPVTTFVCAKRSGREESDTTLTHNPDNYLYFGPVVVVPTVLPRVQLGLVGTPEPENCRNRFIRAHRGHRALDTQGHRGCWTTRSSGPPRPPTRHRRGPRAGTTRPVVYTVVVRPH